MKTAFHPAATSRDFFSVDEIGQLSVGLFGSERAEERLRLLRLENAWGRAVGAHLGSVTRPASCDSSSLVVDVRDVAWKRELDRLKPQILSRLAELLPAHRILEISFRVRKSAQEEPVARPATSGPRQTADLAAAERAAAMAVEMSAPLDQVADGELKNRLSRVMGRYLALTRRRAAVPS